MNLLLPLGVEQVPETFPVELTEALSYSTLFPICAFLPLFLDHTSTEHIPCETYQVCARFGDNKLNLIVSHTPEAFTGEGTKSSFLSSAVFSWECAGGPTRVTSYRQMTHSAQSTSRQSLRPRVTMKKSTSRYREETIIYFLG